MFKTPSFYLIKAPNVNSSDAGNLVPPKRCWQLLPVREKVKVGYCLWFQAFTGCLRPHPWQIRGGYHCPSESESQELGPDSLETCQHHCFLHHCHPGIFPNHRQEYAAALLKTSHQGPTTLQMKSKDILHLQGPPHTDSQVFLLQLLW